MSYQANIFEHHLQKTSRKFYSNQMHREKKYSTVLRLIPVRFGEPVLAEAKIYRKFFYNKNGDVIKKLDFNASGRMMQKEVYTFDGKDILKSNFITPTKLWTEDYFYNEDKKMYKYSFQTPEQSDEKRVELYEFDEQGRKKNKTSTGLSGLKELFTKYIYIGDNQNYTFREVRDANNDLLITLVYLYNKDNKQTGLYGFSKKSCEEVSALMEEKQGMDWQNESDFRTEWSYNDDGNQASILTDHKESILLNSAMLRKTDFDKSYGYLDDKPGRIITEKSTFEYKKLKKKWSLVRTIEWLPRFHEPVKEVKEYTYFDEDGKQFYPETK